MPGQCDQCWILSYSGGSRRVRIITVKTYVAMFYVTENEGMNMEMNCMLPLVGYPYLLQYVHRYAPYVEAISSICNLDTYHAVVTV